jgi:uncharacterized protein
VGMANLGVAYRDGLGGLAKNEPKAVELFQESADLGDDQRMAALAYMYEFGRGGLSKDIPN